MKTLNITLICIIAFLTISTIKASFVSIYYALFLAAYLFASIALLIEFNHIKWYKISYFIFEVRQSFKRIKGVQ